VPGGVRGRGVVRRRLRLGRAGGGTPGARARSWLAVARGPGMTLPLRRLGLPGLVGGGRLRHLRGFVAVRHCGSTRTVCQSAASHHLCSVSWLSQHFTRARSWLGRAARDSAGSISSIDLRQGSRMLHQHRVVVCGRTAGAFAVSARCERLARRAAGRAARLGARHRPEVRRTVGGVLLQRRALLVEQPPQLAALAQRLLAA